LRKINELGSGFAFGEIALMDERALRTATIIAGSSGCDLAYMIKSDY